MAHVRVIPAVLVWILLLISPSTAESQKIHGYFPQPGPDPTVQDVSIIQLIAQPDKFHGKRVRFIGFLRIEFEGTAIYLHREDFDHDIPLDALWVDIPSEMTKKQQAEVNMRYVICVGVFRADIHGHMGMFSGEVTNVQRLEFWSDAPRRTQPIPPPPKAPGR